MSELLVCAEDAKIFREIKCTKYVEMIQKDLHRVSTWSDDWLFHPDKLKKLTITSKKSCG